MGRQMPSPEPDDPLAPLEHPARRSAGQDEGIDDPVSPNPRDEEALRRGSGARRPPAAGSEPADPAPRRRELPKKVLLALGVLVLALSVCEIALRIAGYGIPIASQPPSVLRISEDPAIGYELTPGASGVLWGVEATVNSHGFRDREYEVPKPPGTYRILVLGDSVTFGHRMPLETTYTKRLESMVADRNIEVLNFGVGGYDTLREAATLERHGARFEPDLVLVGYCFNDIRDDTINMEQLRREALARSSLFGGLRIVQFLLNRSGDTLPRAQHRIPTSEFRVRYADRIVDLSGDPKIERTMRALKGHTKKTFKEPHRSFRNYSSKYYVGRLRFGFEQLATLGREMSVDVVLVYLPYLRRSGAGEGHRLVDEIVAHEASRAGLDVLHPLGGVVEDVQELSSLGIDVWHLNERGAELVAEELARLLSERDDWPAAR